MSTEEPATDKLKIKDVAIENEYSILWDVSLGTGINGHVVLCVHRKNRRSFALKCLKYDNPKSLTEIQLQWACRGCAGVVKTFDVFLNTIKKGPKDTHAASPQYLVVMELMQEELFDRIIAKQKFDEMAASDLVRSMGEILKFLHDRDIAHRDLKPENFLYTEKGAGVLKLADFGFAKVDQGDLLTPVFTPYYVPKEILLAKQYKEAKNAGQLDKSHRFTYTKACDMWSLGVIVYIMLCGFPPFQSEIRSQQLSEKMKVNIINGKFSFHPAHWKDISKSAKAVVSALLTPDSSKRMTADELLAHPWVKGEHNEEKKGVSLDRRSLRQTSIKMKRGSNKKATADEKNIKMQSEAEVVKNLRQNSIRGKKSAKSAHDQRIAVARAKSIKQSKKPNNGNNGNNNNNNNNNNIGSASPSVGRKITSAHKIAFKSSIMMEQLINNWKHGSDQQSQEEMLQQLDGLIETLDQDRSYIADVFTSLQSAKEPNVGGLGRNLAGELEKRFTTKPSLTLTKPKAEVLQQHSSGGDLKSPRPTTPGTSPTKRGKGGLLSKLSKLGGSSSSLQMDDGRKGAKYKDKEMNAKNIKSLSQPVITDAFGVLKSAQKAEWYGSALLEKVDSASAMKSARQTADNLIQTCRGPIKVMLAVSGRSIGAIGGKQKREILQIESTSMIHKGLLHSADPFFFAYITQNAMLPFQHMHVFRLKHRAQRDFLLDSLPEGTTEQSEEITSPTAADDKENNDSVIAVRYLGAAPAHARAWWHSHKISIDNDNNSIENLTALASDVLCRPLNGMWGDFLTRAHLQDTGVSVSQDDVTIVDALNPDPRKIPMVNIKNVRMLDIPDSAGRNTSETSEGTPYTLNRDMRMTEIQREAVMAKVKSGEMTVDDAINFVRNEEASLAEIANEKLVCFTHKDNTLNTMHIEVMLCTRSDTASRLHRAISRACDRKARRGSRDPFCSVDSFTDESPLPQYELDRDSLDPIQHIGNGEFGDVYLANHETADGPEIQRAVKTLKPAKGKDAAEAFIVEATIHLKLKHQNVVDCVGVIMTGAPCLVVLEYLLYGDLKKVLVALREKEIDVTAQECTWIMYQLTDAMAYVTSQRIVHMDFALRNCLLGTTSKVKLSDFGIAHHYDPNENGYQLRGKLKIPFLHAPPETLPEKMWTGEKSAEYTPVFNETTDIWSFGVLTWEILSYGQHPYGRVPGVTMLTNLKKIFNGELRLKFESDWPKALVDVAQRCFKENYQRPSFAAVREELQGLMEQSQEGVRDLGKLLNSSLENATLSRAAMASKQRKSQKRPTRKSTKILKPPSTDIPAASVPSTTVIEEPIEFVSPDKNTPNANDGAEWTSLPINLRLNIDDPESSIPSPNRLSQIPKGHFVFPSKDAAKKSGLSNLSAPRRNPTARLQPNLNDSDSDDDFAGFTPRTTAIIEFDTDLSKQQSIL